jgi:hypothetical protein
MHAIIKTSNALIKKKKKKGEAKNDDANSGVGIAKFISS